MTSQSPALQPPPLRPIPKYRPQQQQQPLVSTDSMGRRTRRRTRMISPIPIDDHEDAVITASSTTTNRIVKPIAMKVVRPIPKRMSDIYYDQAYQQGLTLQETNQAAIMAHDWHRKWTQQDEHDHTTPHHDFYNTHNNRSSNNNNRINSVEETVAILPAHYAVGTTPVNKKDEYVLYGSSMESNGTSSTSSSRKILLAHALELDRIRGAKNPSLGDSLSNSEVDDDDNNNIDEQHDYRPRMNVDEERVKRTRQVVNSADRVVSQESSLSLEETSNCVNDVNGHDHHNRDQHVVPPLLNPADRLSNSYSSSSSSSPVVGPQAKKRFFGGSDNVVTTEDDRVRLDDDEGEEYDIRARANNKNIPNVVAPFPIHPNVVRPKAVRIDQRAVGGPSTSNTKLIRPTPIVPLSRRHGDDAHKTDRRPHVPSDIMAVHGRQLSVSPMSCSPGLDSTPSGRSSGSVIGPPPQTVALDGQQRQQVREDLQVNAEPHNIVHIVEDEDNLENDQQVLVEETEMDLEPGQDDDMSQLSMPVVNERVQQARDEVLHALAVSGGEVNTDHFKASVDPLEQYFSKQDLDTRPHVTGTGSIDGMWLTLSKPNYFGCLGHNDNGDPMYTLGRMSFDMFSPTNLVCSLQGAFNPVEIVTPEERKAMLDLVPKSLREEVEAGTTVLRTYHVITAFTIEPNLAEFPDAPNKDVYRPIKGIMTTFGYSLPDPDTPNRHSVWFTGGRLEPNNDPRDVKAWKHLFSLHPPKHSFGEKAKLLAVKLLMGATVPEEVNEEDGSMEYTFTRPLGGHGKTYVDVIYLDDSMRIVRGQRGTTFVFSRMPDREGKVTNR